MTTDQKVTLIRNGLPHNYHMPSTKDFFNGQTPSSGRTFSDGDHIYVYHRGNKFAASHVNIEHASTSPMPLPPKNIRRPPYGPHASCGSCPYSSLDVTHANAVTAEKYSPTALWPACILWFLSIFVTGCNACCCRKFTFCHTFGCHPNKLAGCIFRSTLYAVSSPFEPISRPSRRLPTAAHLFRQFRRNPYGALVFQQHINDFHFQTNQHLPITDNFLINHGGGAAELFDFAGNFQ